MAVELAGLATINLAYFVVGSAALIGMGWVSLAEPSSWYRLGVGYLLGLVIVVVPASYFALVGLPVGWTAFGVGFLVVGLAAWRVGLPRLSAPQLRIRSVEGFVAFALATATLVVLAYAFRTFVVRPMTENDAWSIWTLRGRLLYQALSAAPEVLRSGQYGPESYPIGLPTLDALGFGGMGQYDPTLIGVQYIALAFGFVAALWSILCQYARPLAIALSVAGVVLAPQMLYQLSTHEADVPLGFFVGLGVAAVAAWTAAPDDNWLLGCGAMFLGMAGVTKSEGVMFAAAAVIALLITQIGTGWRSRRRAVLLAVGAIGVIVLPWRIYCSAYGLSTPDYDLGNVANIGYLRSHSDRVGPIVRELWTQLNNSHRWGYLTVVIVAGLATGVIARRWRPTMFALVWLIVAWAGLVLVYWVSSLPTENNLTNSSYRTIVSLLIGGTAMLPVLLVRGDHHAAAP